MLGRVARALVRWRLAVIAVWLVIGTISFTQAPKTPELLALRGGSESESEARRADSGARSRRSGAGRSRAEVSQCTVVSH